MPVTEHIGDIFKVPEGSVLVHSCNCQGSWGSGVAAAFAEKFPKACQIYRDHCLIPDTAHHKKWLVGTCLLIPPQASDAEESGRYWIACLFTSLHYGAKVDKPDTILENTRKALINMRMRIDEKERQSKGLNLYEKLYTIRINSARFGVAWPRSKKILELTGLEFRIVNNVDVMSKKEREAVIKDMKENGFDVDNVAEFTRRNDAKKNVAEEGTASKSKPEKKRKLETSGEEEAVSTNSTEGQPSKENKKSRIEKKEKKPSKERKEKKKRLRKAKVENSESRSD